MVPPSCPALSASEYVFFRRPNDLFDLTPFPPHSLSKKKKLSYCRGHFTLSGRRLSWGSDGWSTFAAESCGRFHNDHTQTAFALGVGIYTLRVCPSRSITSPRRTRLVFDQFHTHHNIIVITISQTLLMLVTRGGSNSKICSRTELEQNN